MNFYLIYFPDDVADMADYLQEVSNKLGAAEMFGVIVGALATMLLAAALLAYFIRQCRRRCKYARKHILLYLKAKRR